MISQKIKSDSLLPSTDAEWTIHSINIQGTFFEIWCQEVLKKSNWKVLSVNYPVEYPEHNGSLIGAQSSLDIYAQIDKQTIKITLLVECKKNNPEFIDWVFFPHHNKDRATNLSGLFIHNRSEGNGTWTVIRQIAAMRSLDWVITNQAWETRSNYLEYKGGKKTKTSNAAITEAAYQVSLATKAVSNEEVGHAEALRAKGSGEKKPYDHQIFVPIIVTTAKLFTCKFDHEKIDGKRGEIPLSAASLEEQPYLLYEYPLPANFRSMPLDRSSLIESQNKDFGSRMDILVVNCLSFAELLKKLEGGNA